jgi:hypothetical protein
MLAKMMIEKFVGASTNSAAEFCGKFGDALRYKIPAPFFASRREICA